MKRPKLKPGDLVKLSKKGKIYPRSFLTNSTMVVCKIEGDGIELYSVITCRVKVGERYEKRKFYRSELWKTGVNVF